MGHGGVRTGGGGGPLVWVWRQFRVPRPILRIGGSTHVRGLQPRVPRRCAGFLQDNQEAGLQRTASGLQRASHFLLPLERGDVAPSAVTINSIVHAGAVVLDNAVVEHCELHPGSRVCPPPPVTYQNGRTPQEEGGVPLPPLPFQCLRLTAKILLRRLRCQEDLSFKIFGPPSN